jgi:hypothetical protein
MSQSLSDAALTTRDALRERVASHLTRRRVVVASLVLVVACGASLRLVGTNWDEGAHLHPDERYLSTVADNTHWPGGPLEYFDVEKSPLSPYNTEQGKDYLYGTLPLFATKLAAAVVGQEGYGDLNLVGRRLAALLDALTILLVFGIAWLLLADLGRSSAIAGALVAAALYAFTVTAIQHSHFFTTDVWVVFFGTLTFLLALRSLHSGVDAGSKAPSLAVLLVGISLGLTVACKVSGALVAIPVAIALLGRVVVMSRWLGGRAALVRLLADAGVLLVSAYVAFRIVSPYTFESSSWLDLSVNDSFRTSLENQARAVAGPSAFPPSYQWQLSSPVWSPLENLALWQLGIPLACAALAGLGVLVARAVGTFRLWLRLRGRLEPAAIASMTSQAMVVAFVATVFLRFGTSFVHSGRYLLPLVPLLSVSAAVAVATLSRARPRLGVALSALLVGATALYAIAFVHIYTEPNTRIAASNWIRGSVPAGSSIANEHWDDALPVGGIWGTTESEARRIGGYHGIQVPVFDPDDSTKMRKLYDALADADYYVLSSPRAWNTIGRMPELFPLMTRFYEELEAGRLGFVRAASFTSYPELAGVRLDDLRAEEAFWVYDHPPVRIFRRDAPLHWESFKAALCPELTPPACR